MHIHLLHRISGLFQNPIAQTEIRYLDRSRSSTRARIIATICLGLVISVAALPFLTYLNYTNLNIFVVSAVVIYAYSAVMEIDIAITACNSIWREMNIHTWESLIMTGLSSRKFVIGKWWGVFYRKRKSIILLALLRISLAYGLMQYLNIYPTWIDEAINSFNRAFYYMSFQNYAATSPLAYYPTFSGIIAAVLVLLAFSLVEASSITAMGILGAFAFRRRKTLAVIFPIFLRTSLIIAGLASLPSIENVIWTFGVSERFVYWGRCDNWFNPNDRGYIEWCRQSRDKRRLSEALQTSVATFADDGVALSANIMRPIGSKQFVMRNLASAALGIIGFMLLTWIILNAVQIMAVRQGMLSPNTQYFPRDEVISPPSNEP